MVEVNDAAALWNDKEKIKNPQGSSSSLKYFQRTRTFVLAFESRTQPTSGGKAVVFKQKRKKKNQTNI